MTLRLLDRVEVVLNPDDRGIPAVHRLDVIGIGQTLGLKETNVLERLLPPEHSAQRLIDRGPLAGRLTLDLPAAETLAAIEASVAAVGGVHVVRTVGAMTVSSRNDTNPVGRHNDDGPLQEPATGLGHVHDATRRIRHPPEVVPRPPPAAEPATPPSGSWSNRTDAPT